MASFESTRMGLGIILLCAFSSFNFTSVSAYTGYILATSSSHAAQSLVCYSPDCNPITAGKINWKPTGVTAVSINDTAGFSGTIWGDTFGWINLQPTGYGLSINNVTGVVSGYAWSHICGWINFAPDGYGVTVVTDTPEVGSSGTGVARLHGFAWCGGEYGGWIKFDCSVPSGAACVRTNWVKLSDRFVSSSGTLTGHNSVVGGHCSSPSGPQDQKIQDCDNGYRSDINDDGKIGLLDFNLLMASWGRVKQVNLLEEKSVRCREVDIADINCSGDVNVLDFNLLMIYWGSSLPPKEK